MSRADQISRLTKDAWPDAGDLVTKILDESKGVTSWRPARAALLHSAQERSWMTPIQLQAFLLSHDFLAKRLGQEKALALLPELKSPKLDYLRGIRPVPKMIALACAHVQACFEMPIPAGDVPAFDRWFTEHFGHAAGVTEFLDVAESYITDRIRGYDMSRTGRQARLAGPALIRALDWVRRMGPFCPFGEGSSPALWPQKES